MTTQTPPDSLGWRLKWLRNALKRRQIEVAEAVGISRSYLGGIEADKDRPGRDTLMALATYYDVSVEWLISGEGPMKPLAPAAQTDDEILLLQAFRSLPAEEAAPLLALILARTRRPQT